MAYKKIIPILSLSESELFEGDFKSESEFIDNLIPKLNNIIKAAYSLDITEYKKEAQIRSNDLYYQIRPDIYIHTKQERDIIIECKNPTHHKAETFIAFSQMMSYKFLLSKTAFNPIMILATSHFNFGYFEFMKYYSLDFDIIVNNKNRCAFWINEFKDGQQNPT